MLKLQKLLILFLWFPVISGFGQTVVWDEAFKTSPDGWEYVGNWGVEDEQLLLYYYPITENYDFTATSCDVNVPANGGELTISMFVDVFMSYVTDEQCEISVLYDDGEDVLWNYELMNGAWGNYGGEEISFDVSQWAGKNIRLKLRSWGATTGSLWGWYIYNINMVSVFDHELEAGAVAGPRKIDPGETGTWNVAVSNLGLQPESGFFIEVFSYKESEVIATTQFTGNLAPGETVTIPFDWSTGVVQNTNLYAVISSQTDEFAPNNRSQDHFVRVDPEFDYQVLFWDNDNDIGTIFNPETGNMEQASQFIEDALYHAGINYDYVNNLPSVLSGYDVIITTMGTYCLS